jgi:hypothetical protein
MDDKKRMASYIELDNEGDIKEIEIVFYAPIPIVDFSIEKILMGKCGGCGERNKKT